MRKAVLLALTLGIALPAVAHAQNAQDDRHHHDDSRGDHHDHGDRSHGDRDHDDRDHGDRGQPQRAPGAPAGDARDRVPGRPAGTPGDDRRIQNAPLDHLDGRGPHSDGRGYPMPVRPDDRFHGNPPAVDPRDHGPAGGWDRDHRPDGGWDRDHRPDASHDRGLDGGWDRDHRPDGNWDRDHRPPPPPGNYRPGYDRPGYGGHDWRPGAPGGGWNRDWRRDQRFDWQNFRSYNRDRFRAPRYYAPRGYAYGYRRWYPGVRIAPFFYGQQYWISDPFFYHLPPTPPGCAWVRYYNDVALVDLSDGEVIDVISDFFF